MSRLRAPNGLLFEFGPDGTKESSTLGCGHCQTTKVVHKDSEKEWGLCYACWRLICGPCFSKGGCVPWEEMLAKEEARFESRRSMGLT